MEMLVSVIFHILTESGSFSVVFRHSSFHVTFGTVTFLEDGGAGVPPPQGHPAGHLPAHLLRGLGAALLALPGEAGLTLGGGGLGSTWP